MNTYLAVETLNFIGDMLKLGMIGVVVGAILIGGINLWYKR